MNSNEYSQEKMNAIIDAHHQAEYDEEIAMLHAQQAAYIAHLQALAHKQQLRLLERDRAHRVEYETTPDDQQDGM